MTTKVNFGLLSIDVEGMDGEKMVVLPEIYFLILFDARITQVL